MSQAQDFATSFMDTLAGSATLNATLKGVFANILANQVTVSGSGEVSFGASFSILSQIFTFISTPDTDRPATGILGYGNDAIDQAKTDAAADQGLTIDDGLTNTNDSRTFTIDSDVSSVTEGETVTFTVTASEASDTDQTLTYQVAGAAIAGDDSSKADPLTDLGILNGQITIPAGQTSVTVALTPASDGSTEGLEGFLVNLLDSNFNVSTSSSTVAIEDPANAGQAFTLTTGSDVAPDYVGGAGDDTFVAGEDIVGTNAGNPVYATHLNATDSLDGGDGNDTLNVTADNAIDVPAMTLTSIENVNLASGAGVTADFSDTGTTTTGLQSVSVTQAGGAVDLDLDDATAASVSGISGNATVAVTGGTTQNVTLGASAGALDLDDAEGAITVTTTDYTAASVIQEGTDVTVTASMDEGNAGDITIGGASTAAASGAVAVTQNITSAGATASSGAVAVTGGTTVDVTVNGTITADEDGDNNTLAADTIGVTGNDDTTTVTVAQNLTATDHAVSASGLVGATQTLTFKALDNGETTTVDSLTFTATKDLTKEEVAQAFANLTDSDTQAAGGVLANGYFSNALGTSGWTSGDAAGAVVVFTATSEDPGALTVAAGDKDPASTYAAGTAASGAESGNVSVAYGAVTIADAGNDSITTVSVDGYAASSITSDALTTLTLANSAGNMDVNVNADNAFTLNVNDVDHAVSLDTTSGADITNLTINATTEASGFALTAAGLTDLTIDASVALDLATSAQASVGNNTLKNVTLQGAGAVGLGNVLADETSLEAFDATANTGGVTATIEADADALSGNFEDYDFSAGNDVVTIELNSGTAADVDVNLGAGNDTLTLASGQTAGAVLDGGAGDQDVLSMTVATAEALDGSSAFDVTATNFERLTLNDTAVAQAIDLDNLTYNYVTTTGSTGAATLDNMASGGTVELTANGSFTVNVKDADEAANTSDVLNVVASVAASDVDQGALTAADVETINITSDDTAPDHDADGIEFEAGERQQNTLDLNAVDATSIVIDGDANLVLDNAGNEKVASIDGSAMTGALTVTAAGGVASTITGGSGNDVLTASSGGVLGTTNATGNVATPTNDAVLGVTGVTGVTAVAQEVIYTFSRAVANTDVISVTLNGNAYAVTADIPGTHANVAAVYAALKTAVEASEDITVTVSGDALTFTADVAGTPYTVDAALANDNSSGGTAVTAPSSGVVANVVAVTAVTAVAEQATLDVTGEFSNSATDDLDQGDSISLTVEGTTYSHTVTAATQTVDSANDALLTLIEANAAIDAASTYDAGTNLFTFVAANATDTNLAIGTDFTVTDATLGDAAGDTLIGGAGNDTLTGGDLATLTGGEGNDTFVINTPTNVNSYSTITDLLSGDVIDLDTANGGTVEFTSAAVTLADTAVFQDYANAAVNALGNDTNDAAWFQFGGNTFIIKSGEDHSSTADFQNGSDAIIQITGQVDLSTASYNMTNGTLEIA